jgi:hypothetical protein
MLTASNMFRRGRPSKANTPRQVDEEVARVHVPSLQFHQVLWMLTVSTFPYVDREGTGLHLPSLPIHRIPWILKVSTFRYVDREEGAEVQLRNLQNQEFL